MRSLLSVQHLFMTYQSRSAQTPALSDLSLELYEGEFVCLVGPSGCGKSTLLTAIAGLDTAYSGRIVHPPGLRIGYMFQRDELLPWRTVFENAVLGLEIQKKKTPEALQRVRGLLHAYGLDGFAEHYPSELSGGMRQRVALIRTMALEPELMLLDEPFSALDYRTRLSVSDEIWRILKEAGKTALMVTHDIAEALSLGDRVIILSERPGHVLLDLPLAFKAGLGPLDARNHPEFQTHFQTVWEVMKHGE